MKNNPDSFVAICFSIILLIIICAIISVVCFAIISISKIVVTILENIHEDIILIMFYKNNKDINRDIVKQEVQKGIEQEIISIYSYSNREGKETKKPRKAKENTPASKSDTASEKPQN